jgi:flagella basal body P-ring formation protein FlgA
MIRLATVIALAALQATAMPAAAQTGSSSAQRVVQNKGPALKAEATIAGELVRIGDLIENAGAVADVAIFRAPDLGQTGSVPASRVADAVLQHHIIGLDTRGIAEVVVTRASRAITAKDIESRILRALAGQYGLAEEKALSLTFDNEVRTLQVEPAAGAELRVTRLLFEARSGRFDVSFELPGSAVARRLPLRFTGTLLETFEALVPARAIAAGEALKASDFTLARRPKAEFVANLIGEAELASGIAARRGLRPGQVVRQTEVMKPEIVQRNETVTITFEVPGIVLSIRGQALEAGALGDVINVLNTQSKRTVQATITGHGRVSVASAASRMAAASAAPVTSRVADSTSNARNGAE